MGECFYYIGGGNMGPLEHVLWAIIVLLGTHSLYVMPDIFIKQSIKGSIYCFFVGLAMLGYIMTMPYYFNIKY